MTTKKLKITRIRKPKTKCTDGLWCGMIPEIYGYGIMVFECTEEQARKSLKKHFLVFKKAANGELTFNRAMEYFGGRIQKVELGKMYYDNLSE
jgi:hypothetical protein